MKHLIALFVVSMFLQPLDLQACPMGADQPISHHAPMPEEGNIECCELDPGESMKDCNSTSFCGLYSPGFIVIPSASAAFLPAVAHRYSLINGNCYAGPPAQPFYRPPIA